MGLSYGEHMAVVFAATMPIFQVILMIGYLKIAGRLRDYFTSGPGRPGHRAPGLTGAAGA